MTDRQKGWPAYLVKSIFRVLSQIYGFIIRGHDKCYTCGLLPKRRLERKVISIGNITVGGTGKTPLVEMLARYISSKGLKPAILTRGYGAAPACGQTKSDEMLLLSETLPGVPVACGRDRFKSAREILEGRGADVFLMDDGFQHRRVIRDLDIVAVDSVCPFGNGSLLPGGIMREPLDALKRADIIVVTKSDLGKANLIFIHETFAANKIDCLAVHAVHQPQHFLLLSDRSEIPLDAIKGQPVNLLSGIGDPAGFERMLNVLGADVRKHFIFPDHCWFKEKDITRVLDAHQRDNTKYLVTTFKDALRLRPFQRQIGSLTACLILKITIEIVHERQAFFSRIDNLLQR